MAAKAKWVQSLDRTTDGICVLISRVQHLTSTPEYTRVLQDTIRRIQETYNSLKSQQISSQARDPPKHNLQAS